MRCCSSSGPPSVGKSSIARQRCRLLEDGRIECAYVERDDFGVNGLLDQDALVDSQEILRSGVAEDGSGFVVAWRIDSDIELSRFRAALPWTDITAVASVRRPTSC